MNGLPSAPVRAGTIRVAAVEDDARYRASLDALFRHAPDFTLVGSFAAPAAAIEHLENHGDTPAASPWDLVLMDLQMPGMSGVECTRRIKARLPDARIVVLTVFEERDTILEAICAGADGYLLKRTSPDELIHQLRIVIAGGSPLSAGVARTVLDLVRHVNRDRSIPRGSGAQSVDLTPRETEVLRCLVHGLSYKAVAAELDISIDTVRSHIRAVYGKLQVHSVAEAVSRALREGLV